MSLNHSSSECDALGACTNGVGSIFDISANDDGGFGGGRLMQEEGCANAEERIGACVVT